MIGPIKISLVEEKYMCVVCVRDRSCERECMCVLEIDQEKLYVAYLKDR